MQFRKKIFLYSFLPYVFAIHNEPNYEEVGSTESWDSVHSLEDLPVSERWTAFEYSANSRIVWFWVAHVLHNGAKFL